MPATQKGAISFGFVHIPVALHTATQDNDIHFNQLCKKDGSRIKYKKVCASCGEEVDADGVVKGFEFAPGQYWCSPSFMLFVLFLRLYPECLTGGLAQRLSEGGGRNAVLHIPVEYCRKNMC